MSLAREIGLWGATFLVIGNIIGAGIFTVSGPLAESLGRTPWLIGVWLVGGVLALLGAFCYSELAVRYPKAGGEYAFLRPTWGPLAAFLSGWASLFIGFTAPIAASALALASYLRPYLPAELGDGSGDRTVAVLTLLLVSFFLSLGLQAGTRTHGAITLLNFILIVLFAGLVLLRSAGRGHLTDSLLASPLTVDFADLGSALVLVMFAYSGWNAAAYIAEEVRTPGRNIPRALLLGTGSVIVVYLLINLAYFSAAPLESLQGQIAIAHVTSVQVLGGFGQNLISLLIVVSVLSSLTAMSIAGPRVYFAMARDRLFPDWLSKVHPTKKVPMGAIWFQTGVAIVFVMVGSFREILLFSGFILILFSTLTVSVLIRGGRHRWMAIVFVGANVLIMANVAWPEVAGLTFGPTMAGLGIVAAGLPVYYLYQRRAVAAGGGPGEG